MVDKTAGYLQSLGSSRIILRYELIAYKRKRASAVSSVNLSRETVTEDEASYFFGEKIKLRRDLKKKN